MSGMTDLCNRCLIQVNATTSVRARFPDRTDFCRNPADPMTLKKWAEDVIAAGGSIEIDATSNRLEAFSTWQGDPVCSVHLWYLVDQEQRRGYR